MSHTLNAKIAQVFDEPGCDVNQSKGAKARKAGCTKQLTPGAAAGGCAFDGAKIALQPIVDVAHLVHGPIACEGNSWDNRHSASSGPQTYRTGFTTDINEFDVIYGGERRLFKAVREIIEKVDPPAVFVYQTCVTAMIGDDIEAVCRRATEKFGKPVIPVNAPGFAGPKNLGNKLGAEALLDYVIGTVEPARTTPCDINIIGEYNLSGELWQVKPLLDALGVRVLSCISGDGRYNEVASAHRARANMMVCSKSMINVATRMQQRWGIPYFEGSFYGIAAGRICSPMASVCAAPPSARSAASGVPPSVVPSQRSGMWPSSEPETSGTKVGCKPKASISSRSSSRSPGVRWLPGSTFTACARRGVSTSGTCATSAVTARAQPSWKAPT